MKLQLMSLAAATALLLCTPAQAQKDDALLAAATAEQAAVVGGKPVIEGLGLPGFGYHSNQAEYVMVDAIPRRLYLAGRMIMDLAQGK